MIVAPPRGASRRTTSRRGASPRNATRLWAAWNRLGGSGMPKGINPAPRSRSSLRVTMLRTATQRNANLEGTRYDPD